MDATVEITCTYAKSASSALAPTSFTVRNGFILGLAEMLDRSRGQVCEANEQDLAAARAAGVSEPLVRRLTFGEKKVAARVQALRRIAALPDPLGGIERIQGRPNGMLVGKMRVPLGVVAMIYEARPHVTLNAAAFCIKSGNAAILRGGKETRATNQALAGLIDRALQASELPPKAVQVLTDTGHDGVAQLVRQRDHVDLVIPRGGPALIDAVVREATVPVLKHYRGVCQAYVHAAANLDKAERVILNSKCFMPEVCNAVENLFIDRAIAKRAVPRLARALREKGVEVRGCERSRAMAPEIAAATEEDFDTEYLDLALSVGIVDGFDNALATMHRHGTGHTEVVLTEDHDTAMRFLREMDAGVVLVNASTMFNDGEELGLGAEVGISTDKLHARGPMGAQDLTCEKWIVLGDGQVKDR